jgi:hypothetical protein
MEVPEDNAIDISDVWATLGYHRHSWQPIRREILQPRPIMLEINSKGR